jgi:hypothetical protein
MNQTLVRPSIFSGGFTGILPKPTLLRSWKDLAESKNNLIEKYDLEP